MSRVGPRASAGEAADYGPGGAPAGRNSSPPAGFPCRRPGFFAAGRDSRRRPGFFAAGGVLRLRRPRRLRSDPEPAGGAAGSAPGQRPRGALGGAGWGLEEARRRRGARVGFRRPRRQSMSDDPKPPRIVERDRRRFTPEGEPRRAPAAPDPASPEPAAGSPRAAPDTAPPPNEDPPPEQGSSSPTAGAADASPPRSPPETPPETPPVGETPAPDPKSDPRLQQLVFLLLHHADLVVRAAEEAAPPPADGGADAAAEGTPPPAAGPEVLEGLQSVIGILEMLEEKTRSRLAEDDSRMLSRVLYQMRMDYIARVGPPGPPGAGAGS